MDTRPDDTDEYVVDDKYFLAAVDLHRLYDQGPIEHSLFARRPMDRYMRTNTPLREELFPEGEFAMLFVDLTSFDADTYKLTYEGRRWVDSTDCLLFTVTPNNSRETGRFFGYGLSHHLPPSCESKESLPTLPDSPFGTLSLRHDIFTLNLCASRLATAYGCQPSRPSMNIRPLHQTATWNSITEDTRYCGSTKRDPI